MKLKKGGIQVIASTEQEGIYGEKVVFSSGASTLNQLTL
jgi:hypothetical protein